MRVNDVRLIETPHEGKAGAVQYRLFVGPELVDYAFLPPDDAAGAFKYFIQLIAGGA